jgi:predicted CopG family antitoxin
MSDTQSSERIRCTVILKRDVYERLKNRGRFGESYSDIVARLLKEKGEQ